MCETGSTISPITPDEIAQAKLSWRAAAPGTDEVTVNSGKAMDNKLLEVIYNIILLRNLSPSSWASLRTIIIPKEGDLTDPVNW